MDPLLRSVVTLIIFFVAETLSALCLSVSVEGPPQAPIRIKQKAQIRFLVDGVPVPAVQTSLFSERSMVATLASAEDGNLTLPELPPGRYSLSSPGRFSHSIALCVVPCPDLGTETTIMVPTTLHGPLQVLDRDALALSRIDLEIGLATDSGWEKNLPAADERSPSVRVSALRGVVEDQTGAIIPNAMVEVIKQGTDGKKQVVIVLFADRLGRFSGHLPDGDYVAVISAPGFRVRVAPFALASSASSTDLQFVLEVGSISETTVAAESAL